jgi:integral membrane protein (TIGR00529 family)
VTPFLIHRFWVEMIPWDHGGRYSSMLFFAQIPALVRLAIVFVIVILLIKKNLSIGNTFFLGAVLLGILFGLGPVAMLKSMVSSVLDPQAFSLYVIVSLILVLSSAMDETGRMKDLLERFRGLIKNPKLNIIVFPSIIGLLPMPGGAIFSAPMVKELGNGAGYSSSRLSFINYWFRHIWEYWWPLYPGVLLLTILAGIPLTTLIPALFPLTLVAFMLGYGVLLGRVQGEVQKDGAPRDIMPFFKGLMPILTAIVGGLGVGFLFSQIFPKLSAARESGMIVALIASIGLVWGTSRMGTEHMLRIAFNVKTLNMIYMIFAVIIFKGVLGDSQAVMGISRELDLLGVPLMVVAGLLPFLVGVITGITIAFVAGAFPILIPLIPNLDPSGSLLAYTVLGMVCGFSGVLFSPVHLCLILSNEFFGTTSGAVYRHLAPRCAFLILAAYLYFFILNGF